MSDAGYRDARAVEAAIKAAAKTAHAVDSARQTGDLIRRSTTTGSCAGSSPRLRFVYREHHAILADDTQPYTDGYRITFDTHLGVKLVDTGSVNLTV